MKRIFKIILAVIILFLVNLTVLHAGQTGNSDVIVGDPDQAAYPYRPGDALLVSTFPDTSSFLNNVFPIDDRGFAEFPIVGKVKVSAMTKRELENYLRDTFKGWLRNPNIYIKPVIRISLVGGFRRPGLYYVDQNSSLWEAVHKAGGHILEDGIYDMKWERNGKKQKGDLTQYYEAGISLQRMGFRSGDQIFTPPISESFWAQFRNDVIPLITFATSMALLYWTYQRDTYLIRSGRQY